MQLTQGHLVEIFGSYGVGKSRLVAHIALEAQANGKNVLFIDTEYGLPLDIIKALKNYWYIGDQIDALEDAVAWARDHRNDYDLLIIDSVGTPVYVNYIELETMDQKLKAFQRLAAIFRDAVRFARGERGVDYDPKDPTRSKRQALAIAVNHCVSEFARVVKDLPESEPLSPFGGAIHRIPKAIIRVEPFELTEEKSTFKLLTYKFKDWPKNITIGTFTIDVNGVWVEWSPEITGIPKPALPPPTPTPAPAPVQPHKLTVEDVRKALPPELMDYLRVEEAADHIKITPRQFLGSENFAKIMESIKPIGGFYVSAGRESHFRVPKG
jgi:hypothetical protein